MFVPQAPYRRSATNATSIAYLAGDVKLLLPYTHAWETARTCGHDFCFAQYFKGRASAGCHARRRGY